MKIKRYIFLFVFLSFGFLKSQFTMHPMVFVGYEYQNQSFGEIGARFLFLKNDNVLYRVSGSAIIGVVNNKFAIIPKVQGDILVNFQKEVDIHHSYYFLAGAEATSKYIAPKTGISLFGILDFTGGYAFQLGDTTLYDKAMKGLNLNFTVNIPLVVFSTSKKKITD